MRHLTFATLAILALSACGAPAPPAPAPDWAAICGRHCAGAPTQVAVGGHHVCLRYLGGAMICWGEVRGRPDDPDPFLVATEVDQPVLAHDDPGRATALVPDMIDVEDMSCGDSFCCAIRQDASLWCWGLVNRWATPGMVRHDDPRLPRRVDGLDDAAAFIGHGHEQLAATSLGDDLLSVGDSSVSRSPASDWPHAPVRAVAYSLTAPSLVAGGHVYVAGFYSPHGVRGTPSEDDHQILDPALSIDDAVDVAAWSYTRCALRASGEVWCWGDARVIWEQTEHEPYATPRATYPARVEALRDIVALEASDHGFCALRDDHQLLCWGIDSAGILRTGHDDGERWTPFALPDASDVVDFDLSDQTLCVIRESGEVACSDLLPPDAPAHSHPRGRLVPVPGLPDLPGDFTDEPSAVAEGAVDLDASLDLDGGP